MPYPAQVDRDAAIDTACGLIEAEGIENLSLARLATALGIKAPSLYHHFASKAELIQDVSLRTSQALVATLIEAIEQEHSAEPPARLHAMAAAYRRFAQTHPATIRLAFDNLPTDTRPDPASLEALALPLQAALADLVGEDDSLAALRGLWSLMHGFVILELNDQFQRGGDLDQTLNYAIDAFAAGCIRIRQNRYHV